MEPGLGWVSTPPSHSLRPRLNYLVAAGLRIVRWSAAICTTMGSHLWRA